MKLLTEETLKYKLPNIVSCQLAVVKTPISKKYELAKFEGHKITTVAALR